MNNYLMIRRISGPIYIITAGVLGLLAEFTRYGWARTWPVWIIVTGLILFAQYTARTAAIARGEYPAVPPAYPPVYPQGPGSEIVSQPPQYPPVEPR
jgi:hypothetical protein